MAETEKTISSEAVGVDDLAKDLIPVINKLRDVLFLTSNQGQLAARLQLPQIVVVGSQSSGKSSVLEGIVGRDFLPRGTGIVTRRPLVLQLFYSADEEYGEFSHKPGEKFLSYKEIKEEIQADTKRLVGDHSISPKPINLKIFSPRVPDLTLVDLPGITKIPTGKQPSDIALKLRQLVTNYISNPNTIILAVSPANQDLANSDALQLALEVDPDGTRTIGVLTKLDLMDRGTNAVDILSNRVIPLKLGYVGVVNRSQQDIHDNKDIRHSLAAEEAFFDTHKEYIPVRRFLGTAVLARRLSQMLVRHIQRCLPTLKSSVTAMVQQAQAERDMLGKPVEKPHEWAQVVLKIIRHVSTQFNASINGSSEVPISTKEYSAGARISYVFHDLFFDALDRVDPVADLTSEHIRTMIHNVGGPSTPLFVPQATFEMLVKQAVQKLEAPCLQAVGIVYTELLTLLDRVESSSRDLLRFGKLRDALHACVVEKMQVGMNEARELVSNLVAVEVAYVSTYHPQFVDVLPLESLKLYHDRNDDHLRTTAPPRRTPGMLDDGAPADLAQPPGRLLPGPATAEEVDGVELVSSLLQLYFGIVKAKMQDLVPKAIMHCLVNRVVGGMESFLLASLYHKDRMGEMGHEDEDTAQRRAACTKQLETLEKAQAILSQISYVV